MAELLEIEAEETQDDADKNGAWAYASQSEDKYRERRTNSSSLSFGSIWSSIGVGIRNPYVKIAMTLIIIATLLPIVIKASLNRGQILDMTSMAPLYAFSTVSDGTERLSNDIVIKSSQDFKRISSEHSTLIIAPDFEGVYTKGMDFVIDEKQNIREIILRSAASLPWLKFLAGRFPNIRLITIDVDRFCSGNYVNEGQILFKKLEKLTLTRIYNSLEQSQFSQLLQILSQWKMPKLAEFEIHSSDLNAEKYPIAQNFIKEREQILDQASYIDCYICSGCSIFKYNETQLKIRQIRIFGRRQQPLIA